MKATPKFSCPKCQSTDLYRSRSTNRLEHFRKAVTVKRPFRCKGCRWRGWFNADLCPTFPASVGTLPASPRIEEPLESVDNALDNKTNR